MNDSVLGCKSNMGKQPGLTNHPASNIDDSKARIFISGLVYDNGKSGIAEYTHSLTRSLIKDREVTIALLMKDAEIFPVRSKNLKIVVVPNVFSSSFFNILWHLLFLPFYIRWTGCHSLIMPALNRRMPLWTGVPVLGIVHDLSQFTVTGKYDVFRMFYVMHVLPRLLYFVDDVIAISECTKEAIIQHWKLNEKEVAVCYNGYDRDRFHSKTPANQSLVLKKYDLTMPYILYVSRIEHPGKNHIELIKAFELLSSELSKEYQIVFAGSRWSGAEYVLEAIEASPLRERFRVLDYVPAAELPALYHGATAVVFPSLAEGFGIPLVEAMACGTPTLCSNRSALQEVVGNAGVTFDPENAVDICEKIQHILNSKRTQRKFIAKGFNRCRRYSWDRVAKTILITLNNRPLKV